MNSPPVWISDIFSPTFLVMFQPFSPFSNAALQCSAYEGHSPIDAPLLPRFPSPGVLRRHGISWVENSVSPDIKMTFQCKSTEDPGIFF